MSKKEKKERLGIVKRYFAWRASNYKDIGRGAKAGYDAAKPGLNAFRVYKTKEEGGFAFQDADGGRERFNTLLDGHGEKVILEALHKWERELNVFRLSAFGCLLLIPVLYFLFNLSIAATISLIFLACAFGVLALRSAFRAWQIRQRRIGSFRDFMNVKNRGSMEIRTLSDE
ncbi:hypothetical protein [Brucella thiophenivorans]|uniref:Uncharacterized protein n=1 Tax=Brucella thiophenivorans TaxID=571255 RepID=A0A256FT35_9HYPH|nr:hypothetical protein [Brucella thiophenivorans]OYR17601.1 hypothetical protein CEV31_4328 [Brucella thiophenivorans]